MVTPQVTLKDAIDAEKASKDASAEVPKAPELKRKEGSGLLVSAVIADQVNPLTNQRIAQGNPTKVPYDRWIEIQLEAKVLAEVSMDD